MHLRIGPLACRAVALHGNAKVTTILTSYLGLYCRTMLQIDGTAARVIESPSSGADSNGART